MRLDLAAVAERQVQQVQAERDATAAERRTLAAHGKAAIDGGTPEEQAQLAEALVINWAQVTTRPTNLA